MIKPRTEFVYAVCAYPFIIIQHSLKECGKCAVVISLWCLGCFQYLHAENRDQTIFKMRYSRLIRERMNLCPRSNEAKILVFEIKGWTISNLQCCQCTRCVNWFRFRAKSLKAAIIQTVPRLTGACQSTHDCSSQSRLEKRQWKEVPPSPTSQHTMKTNNFQFS